MPHCWQGSVANYCEDLYGFVLAAEDDAEIGEWVQPRGPSNKTRRLHEDVVKIDEKDF